MKLGWNREMQDKNKLLKEITAESKTFIKKKITQLLK